VPTARSQALFLSRLRAPLRGELGGGLADRPVAAAWEGPASGFGSCECRADTYRRIPLPAGDTRPAPAPDHSLMARYLSLAPASRQFSSAPAGTAASWAASDADLPASKAAGSRAEKWFERSCPGRRDGSPAARPSRFLAATRRERQA